MVQASQFLDRLTFFAESFTGLPVRIIVKSPGSAAVEETVNAQVADALKIHLPYQVNPRGENKEELALAIYKGLTALQSSALLYNGLPTKEQLKHYHSSSLEDLLSRDSTGITKNIYHVFEVSRRMQCLLEDYPALGEEITIGFSNLFDINTLHELAEGMDHRMGRDVYHAIDLALVHSYWKSLGVGEEELKRFISSFFEMRIRERITHRDDEKAKAYLLERMSLPYGGIWEELDNMIKFDQPLQSDWRESWKKTERWKVLVGDYFREIEGKNPFEVTDLSEIYHGIESRAKDPWSVKQDKENSEISDRWLQKREAEMMQALKQTNPQELPSSGMRSLRQLKFRIRNLKKGGYRDHFSENYSTAHIPPQNGITDSQKMIFQDVPSSQLTAMEIPSDLMALVKDGGKVQYLPELRDGRLVPRAVRIVTYDLTRNQPPTEEQEERKRSLEKQIEAWAKEYDKYEKQIRSDINYVYDLQDAMKRRNAAERKISHLQKELKSSDNLHQSLSSKELEVDSSRVRRIEREMERIKPQARAIRRNCFEGELDEKRFFEYWLEMKAGNDPHPNFYYQWQKRRREVASVLLIDASHSTGRLVDETKSVLDYAKEAAYYFALGAECLEDKAAILAYNGTGFSDSRVYLLKNFSDGLSRLQERMELLRPELNNRDGAAIRYAAQILAKEPAKTRFLFHLGDMQPSDRPPVVSSGIQVYPYEGRGAVEDVQHAFNYAKSLGIIPVGICIKKKKEPSPNQLKSSRLNLAVLQTLKKQMQASLLDQSDERLMRIFHSQYKPVEDITKLPEVLRDVYLRLSFG